MKMVLRPAARPLALAVAMLGAPAAQALQFDRPGDVKASLDTTVSYGVSVRAYKRDPQLIGIANGGTARAVDGDQGDQ